MSCISYLQSSSASAASLGLSNSSLQQNRFAQLDTDDSGTISKDEFVAGRPKNVSADQAAALYDKIDTTGSNALTQDQLDQGLKANRPAHAHHGGGGGSSDSSSTQSSNLSSDTLNILIQLSQSDGSDSTGTSTGDSTDTASAASTTQATTTAASSSTDDGSNVDAALQQLLQAIQAYANNYGSNATAYDQTSVLSASV